MELFPTIVTLNQIIMLCITGYKFLHDPEWEEKKLLYSLVWFGLLAMSVYIIIYISILYY